jgi:hypothetical protein
MNFSFFTYIVKLVSKRSVAIRKYFVSSIFILSKINVHKGTFTITAGSAALLTDLYTASTAQLAHFSETFSAVLRIRDILLRIHPDPRIRSSD